MILNVPRYISGTQKKFCPFGVGKVTLPARNILNSFLLAIWPINRVGGGGQVELSPWDGDLDAIAWSMPIRDLFRISFIKIIESNNLDF